MNKFDSFNSLPDRTCNNNLIGKVSLACTNLYA